MTFRLKNISTSIKKQIKNKNPCASIDARIRDWDVLPGFPALPLLATTYNLAKSKLLEVRANSGLPGVGS
jgi:hypothetical protein